MVSIIVCTYNDSEYLERSLKSCIDQNIDKEIILVDDCSTKPIINNVLKMIKTYSIRYIRHKKNEGLSAARNTGIKNSTKDFIITLDADDFFYARSIKSLLINVEKDYDIFYGIITSAGKMVYPYTEEINREVLMKDNPIFCSSLFRKSIWKKVGGYKVRNGPHYEDWNFWCRCFLHGAKFKYVNSLIYEHTERSDSMLRILDPKKEFYRTIATEEIREAKL